ncbi:MAG TPA: hypothetical protein VHH73_20940, partial [Verrucomicrobiae bacterium]|nr:hypothetical protein [Verrucomicrobiae bacterium]
MSNLFQSPMVRRLALLLSFCLPAFATGARAQAFGAAATAPYILLRENCGTPGSTLQPAGTLGGNGGIDPGELVEVRFAFTNNTGNSIGGLSIFMMTGGGVVSARASDFFAGSAPQGGRIEAVLQFVATGNPGDTIQAQVAVNAGISPVGTVTFPLRLGKVVSLSSTYANPAPLVIPTLGPASIYPSAITVPPSFTGKISSVRVGIHGFAHQHPADVQMMLVSPQGSTALFWAAAGGETPASGLDIMLDDAAAVSLPPDGPLVSGTFKSTAWQTSFPFPGNPPLPPYGASFGVFNGSDARGDWKLYVADVGAQDGGQITGGWELQLSTEDLQSCVSTTSPTLNYPSSPQATPEDKPITLTLGIADDVTPFANLQIAVHSSRQNLIPDSNIVLTPVSGGLSMTLIPLTNAYGVGPGQGADITTRVTDGDGLFTEKTFRLDVTPVNDLPTLSALTNIVLSLNQASDPVSFTIGDVETPVDQLVLIGASSQPSVIPNSGVVFGGNGSNRTVTVFPANNRTGFSDLTVTVLDQDGGSVSTNFLVIVGSPNSPPVISDIPPQDSLPDFVININFQVSDADSAAETLVLAATSSNTNLVPNANLVLGGAGTFRTLKITPSPGLSGTTVILVTAKDINGAITGESFVVNVRPPPVQNIPPAISGITNRFTSEGTAIDIPFTVSDIDSDLTKLVLAASADLTSLLPPGAFQFSGSGNDRILRVTPALHNSGVAVVTVTVTDDSEGAARTTFSLTVSSINHLPEITALTDASTTDGVATAAQMFNIADQETTFDDLVVSGHSSDQSLAPDTGITFGGSGFNRSVTVQPAVGRTGTATITVVVTDADGGSAARSFRLTVTAGAIPRLSISAGPSGLVISWPTTSAGFVLEQTASLASPAWSPVAASPTVVGDRLMVVLVPGETTFFRLRRP